MKDNKDKNFADSQGNEVVLEEKFINIEEFVKLKVTTFETKKSNPKILFIPGWVSQFDGWQEVVVKLSESFTVYYLETREKISSKIPYNSKINVEIIATDIAKAVNKLSLENDNFLVFGSSLGATAIVESFKYLEKKPKGIVLMGPNVHFRMPWWGRFLINHFPIFLSKPVKEIAKFYLKHFRLNYKNDPDQFETYKKAIDGAEIWKLKNSGKGVQSYQIWDSVKFIDRPSLVISATEDKLHEPENIEKLHKKLPESEILRLKTHKDAHKKIIVKEIWKFWKDQ